MQITVQASVLARGLKDILGSTGSAIIPMVGNVLVEAKVGEGITLSTTDLNTYTSVRLIDTSVGEGGTIALPAKLLHGVVAEFRKDAEVTMATDARVAKISCGSSSVRLAGSPADEFPVTPEHKPHTALVVPADTLFTMLRRVVFAADENAGQFYVRGVLLKISPASDGTKLVAVATDGFRIAEATANVPGDDGGGAKLAAIIPKKGLRQVVRLLEGREGDVTVSFSESFAVVATAAGDLKIAARLLAEGKYPEYEKFFPETEDAAEIPTKNLQALIKRVGVMANGDNSAIDLALGPDGLTATAESPDLGNARDKVEIVGNKPADWEARYNATYLLDGLSVVDEEKVRLVCADSTRTLLIAPGNAEAGFRYIVMPMSK